MAAVGFSATLVLGNAKRRETRDSLASAPGATGCGNNKSKSKAAFNLANQSLTLPMECDHVRCTHHTNIP